MANWRTRRRHGGWLALVCLTLCASAAAAEQKLYSLEIPDARAATFEVLFEVEHPGEIAVHANWAGSRALAFRIEPPDGDSTTVRRNGPSPIHMKLNVGPEQLGHGPWKLIIHALPVRGAATGRVAIDLPGPILQASKEISRSGLSAPRHEKPLEPWQEPRAHAEDLSDELLSLVRSTESFRELLVDSKKRVPDTCRWQDDLLHWLAIQRDLAIDQGIEPDPATGALMSRLAGAIRVVDEIRVSRDPVVVGPVPGDERMRASWGRLRSNRLIPVKRELDDVLTSVLRNHAPELSGERWPLRMVSCLTATERYFEQRWIAGNDAPNRDLAEAQWSRLDQAAKALEAFARLAQDDAIRLQSRR